MCHLERGQAAHLASWPPAGPQLLEHRAGMGTVPCAGTGHSPGRRVWQPPPELAQPPTPTKVTEPPCPLLAATTRPARGVLRTCSHGTGWCKVLGGKGKAATSRPCLDPRSSPGGDSKAPGSTLANIQKPEAPLSRAPQFQ